MFWEKPRAATSEAGRIALVPDPMRSDLTDLRAAQSTPEGTDGSITGTGVRRWGPIAICGLAYLAISLVDFGHFDDVGSAHIAGGGGADQIIQVWWIDWVEKALAQGHNLFFSNWINYPVGENFGPNGSMLAIGTLLSPITAIFGPVVSWNVVVRLAMFLSAFSMCLVLRRWTRWWPAAFVGGLLYGFCVYETTSANGYAFTTFVPLPPLIFLLVHEGLVRQRWKPRRVGILLAVVCAAQFFVSSEIFTSTIMLALIAVVLFLLSERRAFVPRWPYARIFGIWTIVVGGILLAAPVAFTLFGPQAAHGAPNSPASLAQFHGDLLGGIAPTYIQRFTTPSLTSFAFHFGGSGTLYVGLPFIVFAGGTVVWLRKRGIVVMAGIMTVLSFILSLGSRLYIGGHNTHVPLPFIVVAHLPLVQGLAPVRFSLFTSLFGGAVVAIGLDEIHRRWSTSPVSTGAAITRQRQVKLLVVVLAIAVIVVVPVIPRDAQAVVRSNISPFFSSKIAAADIPPGSAVLAYPYPDSPVFPGAYGYSFLPRYQAINDPLLDQAAAGMPFKLIGSYGWRPSGPSTNTAGPSQLEPASVQALFDFEFYGVITSASQRAELTGAHLVTDLRQFLANYHVGTVVDVPVGMKPKVVAKVISAAIGPPTKVGSVDAWFGVRSRLDHFHGHVNPPPIAPLPSTQLLGPKSGQRLRGHVLLFAKVSAPMGVSKVEFEFSSDGRPPTIIGRAKFFYGWLDNWNTTTVPDGSYTVYSVVVDKLGRRSLSAGIPVSIDN